MTTKKKLFETFSFGYGNNDYLSDIGTPDTKDKFGATAFQPGGVGTRMGLVNELKNFHKTISRIIQNHQIKEDGTTLHSTPNLVGDIDKPTYRQGFMHLDETQKKILMQHIKEFQNSLSDYLKKGVGDKYLDNKYPNHFQSKEPPKTMDCDEIITGYPTQSDVLLKIYKNPKSLDGLAQVRGVIDKDGNIYLEDRMKHIHHQIVDVLSQTNHILDKSKKNRDLWSRSIPRNFLCIIKDYNGRVFYVADSYYEGDTEERQNEFYNSSEEILKRAQEKHPDYHFFNIKNPHDTTTLTERQKKYIDGSIGVDVKKQCRLGGLNGTSKACNQGNIDNLEFTTIKEGNNPKSITQLHELPFIDDIRALGGEIYAVGGIVRDELIGKESNDLDVVVTGVPLDDLKKILSDYGKADFVGEAFGGFKFKPKGSNEEIDVVLPRTEKPTGGGGHRDFDVIADHNLSIEDDLFRRDVTINAIAKDIYGNYIDPYGGIEDIKNKQIKQVNPDVFMEDPLRMLRAIQFSARFGFNIEPSTFNNIKDNAENIKKITPERILKELNKIAIKGDAFLGAKLLEETNLYKEIFNSSNIISRNKKWDNVNNLGDFFFLLTEDITTPSKIFKIKFKGDNDTTKYIEALEMGYNYSDTPIKNRFIVYNMYNKSHDSLDSEILPEPLQPFIREFKMGKYPKTLKELDINGNDIMEMGYKGEEIGNKLKLILGLIYGDKLLNKRNEIMNFLKKKEIS